MMSYSDSGLWVILLVGIAFFYMCHRRSLRGAWKDLTGPNWFAALVSYSFLIGAVFLFFAFYGTGRYGPVYPHSPWRPVALIASICLFVAYFVVSFKYVGAESMKRLRRRRSRSATGFSNRTDYRG